MSADFCRHLVGKTLWDMFVTVIALKYALLVSQWSCGHFLKLTDSVLFQQHKKSLPFNSTHCVVLYPQNGDPIVTIDYVTSLPLCIPCMNTVREHYVIIRPEVHNVLHCRLRMTDSRDHMCVTSRYRIKTAERIELVIGKETATVCFKYSAVPKIGRAYTSIRNFVRSSELGKIPPRRPTDHCKYRK